MATVYILYSEQLDRFYTGSCDKLDFRLEQHLSRNFEKSFTAKANDWGLFFSVTDLDYKQARLIEKHIKQMKSRSYINNLTKYPEIIEKLKLQYG